MRRLDRMPWLSCLESLWRGCRSPQGGCVPQRAIFCRAQEVLIRLAPFLPITSGFCRILPGFLRLLGHMSWFAQLSRPVYSCFLVVYDFARLEQPDTARTLPGKAACKILMLCLIGIWVWRGDSCRRQGCCSTCGMLCRCYRVVRSCRQISASPERRGTRVGTRCEFGFSKHHFRPVLAQRARFKAHSAALEASGLSLAVKWVPRDRRRHSRQVTMLVDAQAVLGAAARGRSSAKTFGREIKRLAALVLGGDLLIRYVHISSEDDPGDAPSRNKHDRASGGHFDKRRQRTARLDRARRSAGARGNLCPGCGVEARHQNVFVADRFFAEGTARSGTSAVAGFG